MTRDIAGTMTWDIPGSEMRNVPRHRRNDVATHHTVGLAGFEPTTSSPPVKRATKLRYSPCPCRLGRQRDLAYNDPRRSAKTAFRDLEKTGIIPGSHVRGGCEPGPVLRIGNISVS